MLSVDYVRQEGDYVATCRNRALSHIAGHDVTGCERHTAGGSRGNDQPGSVFSSSVSVGV